MSNYRLNAGNIAQYFTHAQDVDIAREIETMTAADIVKEAPEFGWDIGCTLEEVEDALPLAREIVRDWIADRA